MNNTHEFKLLTGVKCTISEMDGSSQNILTRAGNTEKKNADFSELLRKHIVSLGTKTNITDDDIQNLLVWDRKKILVELRQFTLGNPKKFNFKYTWTEQNKAKNVEHIEWDLENMFAERPYSLLTGEFDEAGNPIIQPMECSEYSQVLQKLENKFTLPRSGKLSSITFPTTAEQNKWAKTDPKSFSSHTELQIFNPVYYEDIAGKETRVMIEMNRLAYLDIEKIREIKNRLEGNIDTIINIENKDNPQQKASLDLTQEISFFFPSRAV